jgi:hypothetical protein
MISIWAAFLKMNTHTVYIGACTTFALAASLALVLPLRVKSTLSAKRKGKIDT